GSTPHALTEPGYNCVYIKYTSAPGAAAGALQSRPKSCRVRQVRVAGKIWARLSPREDFRSFFWAKSLRPLTHQVYASLQAMSIYDDLNTIAIENFADGTTGECLGTDMPNAGAG